MVPHPKPLPEAQCRRSVSTGCVYAPYATYARQNEGRAKMLLELAFPRSAGKGLRRVNTGGQGWGQ